jgi:thiol-disulfide isomerase/thioredoxin
MMARKQNIVLMAGLLASGGLQLAGSTVVPRPSPELAVAGPAGSEIRLSNFKGKVVVVEFLLTNCPHCRRVAQMIESIEKDLGSHGFQPLGMAFDSQIDEPAVTNFVRDFHISYPVGYTSSTNVDEYLGRTGTERFQVPQIVVIDREGVIRAQSQPIGETALEGEAYLHKLVETLLGKNTPPASAELAPQMRTNPAMVPVAVLIAIGGFLVWRNQKKQRLH